MKGTRKRNLQRKTVRAKLGIVKLRGKAEKRRAAQRMRRRVRKMRLRVKKVNTYFYVILFR